MALVVFEIEDLEKVITNCVDHALSKYTLTQTGKTPGSDELLQVDEVAKILNVSISTLHTYKKNCVIPFHRIGRRVYFKKSEVLESLKKIN